MSLNLAFVIFKNGQRRISSMMSADAEASGAAATMEPTAVLPDMSAATCDDDGETLILYPLTTPNGSARYESPESLQFACKTHTPPTKAPSSHQKVRAPQAECTTTCVTAFPQVVSNTRRTVQREVLADVLNAAARRVLKAVFLAWRLHSGLPKRTPSVVLAELTALVEQQVASAKQATLSVSEATRAHAQNKILTPYL